MSVNALLLLQALSGEAEAATVPTPDASTAELLAQCTATDDKLTRRNVESATGQFNAGLQEALRAPTKKELAQALAQALWSQLKVEVSPEEISARLKTLEATLDTPVNEQSKVEPNRELIRTERQETRAEQALLDLVVDVKGKPYSVKDLLAEYPAFKEVYVHMKAKAFAMKFQEKHGLDCGAAVAYALKTGDFPDVRASVPTPVEPKMELTVSSSAVPALEEVSGSDRWQEGLGFEYEEMDKAYGTTKDLEERATGLDRVARAYHLGDYTGPAITITINQKVEEAPKKQE